MAKNFLLAPKAAKEDVVVSLSGDHAPPSIATPLTGQPEGLLKTLLPVSMGAPVRAVGKDGFLSSTQKCYIKAYHNVNDGLLYPTDAGVVFVQKPLLFIPVDEIESFEMGRGGSSMNRTFDLEILCTGGVTHQFGMIEREEQGPLMEYVMRLQHIKRKRAGDDEGESHDGEGEGAYDEEQDSDFCSEDEEDTDDDDEDDDDSAYGSESDGDDGSEKEGGAEDGDEDEDEEEGSEDDEDKDEDDGGADRKISSGDLINADPNAKGGADDDDDEDGTDSDDDIDDMYDAPSAPPAKRAKTLEHHEPSPLRDVSNDAHGTRD